MEKLRKELAALPGTLLDVRLFAKRQGMAHTTQGECSLSFAPDGKELQEMAQQLCGHMLRLSPETTGQGFITLRGGHRMGLCGRITQRDGQLVLQEIGSVCIRVAHEIRGCGAQAAALFDATRQGILLCGAPGSGKTTWLRDAVRSISDGGTAVGLSDERSEIAACVRGIAQIDVGRRTHVLDGCPKAEALRWLLRAMNPQLLAMDEIYGAAECGAVREAAACGVPVLATAHAGSPKALRARQEVYALIKEGVFGHVIFLQGGQAVNILSAQEAACCGR